MAKKSPAVNPKTRETPPEPKAVNDPTELAPIKHKLIAKKARPGWCKFVGKGLCYLESATLEAEQEISLSPAASYRQRNNRNIELIEGVIPTLPEDAPVRPSKDAPNSERRAFLEYEVSFIDDLEDGDPRVGPGPAGLKLIKQG